MENYLSNLVSKGKLTPDGMRWLVHAIDPFHDYEVVPEGYPDSNGGMSFTTRHVGTATIARPATVAAGNNWSCVVYNNPLRSGGGTVTPDPVLGDGPCAADGVTQHVTTYTTHHHMPFMVLTGADGAQLMPSSSTAMDATSTQIAGMYSENEAQSMFPGRVLAQGFEVHNTTASIARQGTITVARVPYACQDKIMWVSPHNPSGTNKLQPVLAFNGIMNQSQAVIHPSSMQWEAAKGVYCVNALSSIDQPIRRHQPLHPIGYTWHESIGTPHSYTGGFRDIALDDIDFDLPYEWCRTDMDCSIVYFTGLSSDTTLTVTTKTILEYFPEISAANAAAVTRSPSLDMAALKIYSALVNKMPAGCPVSMNSKGDWWRNLMSIAAVAIPLIGLVAPQITPFTSALQATAKGIGNWGTAPNNPTPKKKKNGGQPQPRAAARPRARRARAQRVPA